MPVAPASATAAPPSGRTNILATSARRIAVLAQDVADARAVAGAGSSGGRPGVKASRRAARRARGRTRFARLRRARGRGSRSPRPMTRAVPSPRPSCSSNADELRPTDARRKIVNEIARFQRFSRVTSAGARRPDGDERPLSPRRARSVRPGSVDREAARDALEQIVRVDAVVVRERDELGAQRARRGVAGARQASLARAAASISSERMVARGSPRAGRRRSGRRAGPGTPGGSGASSDSSSRSSSAVGRPWRRRGRMREARRSPTAVR